MDHRTIGGKEYTRLALSEMNAAEVRSIAKLHREELGLSGYQCAGGIDRAGLIARILDEAPAPAPAPHAHAGNGQDAKDLVDVLRRVAGGALDEARVREIAKEEAAKAAPLPISLEIKQDGKEPIRIEGAHESLPLVARYIEAGVPVFLVGPSGSGKTEMISRYAHARGIPYRAVSVCRQTTKSDLLGYMDVTGKYVPSSLYECYREDGEGGIYLLDEVDAGNENSICVLNAGTSNGEMAFPCGMVRRHPNFKVVCAGNTFGKGADRMYVGRVQLDAAFTARFMFVAVDYDTKLEHAISAQHPEVARRIQKYRDNAQKLSLRVVIGTRQIVLICKALDAGDTLEGAEHAAIFCSMDADTRTKVKGA